MGLQAEPPLGMRKDVLNHFIGVLPRAGLQKVVLGRECRIVGKRLPDVNYFHLVDVCQDNRGSLFG